MRVGAPGGFIALAVGQCLNDRDAEFGQFAAPAFGIEDDLGIDYGIGNRLAIHRQHLFVRADHRRVIRQRNRTGGFDAGDQVIDKCRLLGTDVDLVKRDGNGRRAFGNVDAFPAEILGRRGEDKIRCFRVVDRSIGKNEGRGDADQGFALTMGRQGLEKTFVIGLAS